MARALARAGHEVVVLEKADTIGSETSSRHSEVIHAESIIRRTASKRNSALRESVRFPMNFAITTGFLQPLRQNHRRDG